MADETMSRRDMLKLLRAAEIEGAKRERNAHARVARIKSDTQTECAHIVEEAEREGRAAMRKTIEDARAECAQKRAARVSVITEKGKAEEEKYKAMIPAVADMMFNQFKKEYNVKN